MANTIKQNQVVVWVQEGGAGASFVPYADREQGMAMTGKTIPVIGQSPVYVRDENGRPVVIDINETPPGDLPSATIQVYDKATITILETMVQRQCPLNFQLRYVACGPLDNPFIWDKLYGLSKGRLTTYNPGDGPSLEFSGELMTASGAISFLSTIILVRTGLSSLTLAEVQSILAIAGIPDEDCAECGTGYPGADNILAIGAAAAGAAIANGYVSEDGGSTWTVFSSLPFIADEDWDFLELKIVGPSTVRFVASTSTTAAGGKQQIAYAEADFGALETVTWTKGAYTATVNGDLTTAMLWVKADQLYIANDANQVILDTKQGADLGAAIAYTAADIIRAFAASRDGRTVYAAGDTNAIARNVNNTGFVGRNGPSGGGNFTALEVADDGTLFAGNGTSIYKSVDGAAQAGNWTLLNNFGAGFTVKKINAVKGDSNYLRVVATEAADGHTYESIDGGNSWREVTGITDAGYSDAYFSKADANLAYIAGLASGGLGQVHQLAPTG